MSTSVKTVKATKPSTKKSSKKVANGHSKKSAATALREEVEELRKEAEKWKEEWRITEEARGLFEEALNKERAGTKKTFSPKKHLLAAVTVVVLQMKNKGAVLIAEGLVNSLQSLKMLTDRESRRLLNKIDA